MFPFLPGPDSHNGIDRSTTWHGGRALDGDGSIAAMCLKSQPVKPRATFSQVHLMKVSVSQPYRRNTKHNHGSYTPPTLNKRLLCRCLICCVPTHHSIKGAMDLRYVTFLAHSFTWVHTQRARTDWRSSRERRAVNYGIQVEN